MASTMGIKVDDALRERIRNAAHGMERTPHWLVKQAIVQYVEALERGQAVMVSGLLNRLTAASTRVAPRGVLRRAVAKLQSGRR